MQELKFKNIFTTFILFIIFIAASSGITAAVESQLGISPVEIPMPLLIIGIFAAYILPVFIFKPNATTGQSVQITLTGMFLNILLIVITVLLNNHLSITLTSLNSDFILTINPIIILSTIVFGHILLNNLVKLEQIHTEETPQKKINNATNPVKQPLQDKQKPTTQAKDEPVNKVDSLTETIPFTTVEDGKTVKLSISEKKEEKKPSNLYEEIYPQAKYENKKELNEDDIYIEMSESDSSSKKEAEPQITLENTPEININENEKEINKNTVQEEIEQESTDDYNEDEYIDFIPTDIRLVEAPLSKEVESKGKIASIGKLLVNNKNIENVIESSESSTESFAGSKTNIVSSLSGEQIYEKFNLIKEQFSEIKEMALIDKGGFVKACDFENKQQAQLAGALVAGAYHTLQNYLAQIKAGNPIRIFFETEEAKSFVIKAKDEILFSIWEKSFKQVDYNSLLELIEKEEFNSEELNLYQDLNKIENYTLTNNEGQIISHNGEDSQSQIISAVTLAIFENLKVFFMNIQLANLKKITIFTTKKVIVIKKYKNITATFIMNPDELVKVSEELLKMEEIY